MSLIILERSQTGPVWCERRSPARAPPSGAAAQAPGSEGSHPVRLVGSALPQAPDCRGDPSTPPPCGSARDDRKRGSSRPTGIPIPFSRPDQGAPTHDVISPGVPARRAIPTGVRPWCHPDRGPPMVSSRPERCGAPRSEGISPMGLVASAGPQASDCRGDPSTPPRCGFARDDRKRGSSRPTGIPIPFSRPDQGAPTHGVIPPGARPSCHPDRCPPVVSSRPERCGAPRSGGISRARETIPSPSLLGGTAGMTGWMVAPGDVPLAAPPGRVGRMGGFSATVTG